MSARLYRVTVTVDVYMVSADGTPPDAFCAAREARSELCDNPGNADVDVEIVRSLAKVARDWQEAIPRGEVERGDDREIRQRPELFEKT